MNRFTIFILLSLLATSSTANENHHIIDNANKRFDGAPSYLVLIKKVELNKGSITTAVQSTLSLIAKRSGRKFSARVFDSKIALDLYISKVGATTLSAKEENLVAVHLLATYTGELSTNWAKYTLSYFPSASSKHPVVGKYVDTDLYEPVL